jgi:hypothetical protein
MLATATWPRVAAGAQQALAQPKREALLSDTQWPLEKQRTGERATLDRILQALPKRLVAIKWEERHEAKLRSHDPFRRVARGMPSRHGS